MSPSLTENETKYLYKFCMATSILCFCVCVLIFLSGICISDATIYNAAYERRQLQFISTQIGACLHDFSYVSWGFVFATQCQMLLLYFSFLRLLYHRDNLKIPYYLERDQIALFSGYLLTTFVVSLASVVEFRSMTPSQLEGQLHYIAAFVAIVSFFIFQVLLSACLHSITDGKNEYNLLKLIYFILTVLFLFTWIIDTLFSSLTASAKLTEWLVLFSGISLHLYALLVIQHTNDNYSATVLEEPAATSRKGSKTPEPFGLIVMTLFGGLFLTILWALTMLRVVKGDDLEYVQTGISYWVIIVSTYLLVIFILYSTRHHV
jgi:hypothetical protein